MCRYWAVALLGILLFRLTDSEAKPDVRLAESVVQVRGIDPTGQSFFGSGVVISQGWVATNCHVVRSGGAIGVFRGNQGYRVTLERVDEWSDLCLLNAPSLDLPPARLSPKASLHRGDPLFYYGFPRALGLSYAEGRVENLGSHAQLPLIETSAFFTLGGSGGGVFDRKGRLVGLATFLARGHAGGFFAIGSDLIAVVQKKPARPVTPLQGTAFWERQGFDAKQGKPQGRSK